MDLITTQGQKLEDLYGFRPNMKIERTSTLDEKTLNEGASVTMSEEGYKSMVRCQNGKNLYWTTDINVELPIKISKTGISSAVKPETLPEVFLKAVKLRGDSPSLRQWRNGKEVIWTWNEFLAEVLTFAKCLQVLGVPERKAVNIRGFNGPEWLVSFYGAVFHNNIGSGVYMSNGPDACQYQAEHSEAQVICVDTLDKFKDYYSILPQLKEIKALVIWGLSELPPDYQNDKRLFTWS